MDDETIVDLYLQKDEKQFLSRPRSMAQGSNEYLSTSFRIFLMLKNVKMIHIYLHGTVCPHSPKQYLFSFLAKITRNISINLYNKNRAQKRYANIVELTKEMEECIPSPNDEVCKITETELTESISKFLRTACKEERAVFVTRYWYSEPIKEIANKFGISGSKVKSMLMRTRNKLKKHFESEGLEL